MGPLLDEIEFSSPAWLGTAPLEYAMHRIVFISDTRQRLPRTESPGSEPDDLQLDAQISCSSGLSS
jgi:hypothetical protein